MTYEACENPILRFSGRNLIPKYSKSEDQWNNVSVSFDEDGTIHLNGNSGSEYEYIEFVQYLHVVADDYYISGVPIKAQDVYIAIQKIVNGTAQTCARDYGNGAAFTLTEPTVLKLLITIPPNTTFEDYILKPMLEKGKSKSSYIPAGSELCIPYSFASGDKLLIKDRKVQLSCQSYNSTYTQENYLGEFGKADLPDLSDLSNIKWVTYTVADPTLLVGASELIVEMSGEATRLFNTYQYTVRVSNVLPNNTDFSIVCEVDNKSITIDEFEVVSRDEQTGFPNAIRMNILPIVTSLYIPTTLDGWNVTVNREGFDGDITETSIGQKLLSLATYQPETNILINTTTNTVVKLIYALDIKEYVDDTAVDIKKYVDNTEVDIKKYVDSTEVGVGKQTDFGGEIFNDYENNQANAPFSAARGYCTEANAESSDAGGYVTKAMAKASFSRGTYNFAGTKAFNVKSIDFEEEFIEDEELDVPTYYVSNTGDDTNDGSLSNPFKTIEGAISHCNYIINAVPERPLLELIKLVVIGTNHVAWTTGNSLPSHKYKVIITSGDEKVDLICPQYDLTINGPIVLQNINLMVTKSAAHNILVNANNIAFLDNVWVSPYIRFASHDNSNKDINVNILNVVNDPIKLYLGNKNSNKVFEGDINVSFDTPNVAPYVFLGSIDYATTTTYKGNINLNVKSTNTSFSLMRSTTNKAIAFAEGTALQIINSSENPIVYNRIDEQVIKDAGAKYYILSTKSYMKDILGFTKDAGKFTVKEGYKAHTTDSLGNLISSDDGILDLSSKDGEYSIKIVETKLHVGTIQLDSIEGLKASDLISIKDSVTQSFSFDKGKILSIDENTNTLSVEGYRSDLDKFSLKNDTYLFVLEKPNLGTSELGDSSDAFGKYTQTIGKQAHTNGIGTVAIADNQTAIGEYNDNKEDTLFEVGNGESDTHRSNAFEVYKDGHAEVQTMGSTDNSVATKKYVDDSTALFTISNVINDGSKSLTVNDVLPLAHKCSLKLTSDRYDAVVKSKNIFNYENGKNIDVSELFYVINNDGSISINGSRTTDPTCIGVVLKDLIPNQTYTFSLRSSNTDLIDFNDSGLFMPYVNGEQFGDDVLFLTDEITFIWKEDYEKIEIKWGLVTISEQVGEYELILYPQLELGDTMTDWMPYGDIIESKPYVEDFSTVTVNVNGKSYIPSSEGLLTGIESVSPTMEITTDNEHVNITDFTYLVDTKKYIDNNTPDVDLSDYYTKEEVDSIKVGQKISEGGEIFNDYDNNIASAQYATATGSQTHAAGTASHTSGSNTIANQNNQFVVGKYNDNKDDTLFEVGNGDSTTRSNAFEVYSDGSISIGGVKITPEQLTNLLALLS